MGEKLKFRCIDRPDREGNYLYAVRFPEEIKTVRSLVNEILGQKTWGFITIRLHGGDLNIRYRGTKLLDRVDPNVLNMKRQCPICKGFSLDICYYLKYLKQIFW